MPVYSSDAMTAWCVQVCWTFFIVSWLTVRRHSTSSKNNTSAQLSLSLINTAEIQRSAPDKRRSEIFLLDQICCLKPWHTLKNLHKKLVQLDMLSCASFFFWYMFLPSNRTLLYSSQVFTKPYMNLHQNFAQETHASFLCKFLVNVFLVCVRVWKVKNPPLLSLGWFGDVL